MSRDSIRAIVEKSRRWDTQANCDCTVVPNDDIEALLNVADAAADARDARWLTTRRDALVDALRALDAME